MEENRTEHLMRTFLPFSLLVDVKSESFHFHLKWFNFPVPYTNLKQYIMCYMLLHCLIDFLLKPK